MQKALTVILAISATTLSGCGVLIGSVKPVSEKSQEYKTADLSQDSDWERLPDAARGASDEVDHDEAQTQISDVAYQSKSTASIISLNSACRSRHLDSFRSLEEYRDQVLLGMSLMNISKNKTLQVSGHPALQSTVSGNMNGEPVKIDLVVLKSQKCVYDAMYIARPNFYQKDREKFTRFLTSLRIP